MLRPRRAPGSGPRRSWPGRPARRAWSFSCSSLSLHAVEAVLQLLDDLGLRGDRAARPAWPRSRRRSGVAERDLREVVELVGVGGVARRRAARRPCDSRRGPCGPSRRPPRRPRAWSCSSSRRLPIVWATRSRRRRWCSCSRAPAGRASSAGLRPESISALMLALAAGRCVRRWTAFAMVWFLPLGSCWVVSVGVW